VRHALQGMALLLLVLLLIPFAGTEGFWLGAGILLTLLGTIWFIQQPYWGVLILITLAIIDIDPVGIRYLGFPYLVSAILTIPLALRILHDREVWVWRVPQIQIFLAIGLLFLVSTLWSDFKYEFIAVEPDKDFTLRQLVVFFSRLGFFVFFLYFVNTRQKIELTVWWVLGLITLIALDAFHFFVTTGMTHRSQASFSLAENSNRLAYICIFTTALLWFYRTHGPPARWKAFTLPLLFFFPLNALSAGSRSGLLQLCLLTALIVKEQERWALTKQIRTFFLIGAVALLAFAFIPETLFERLFNFETSGPTEAGVDSLRNRISTDRVALMMGLDNPVLGVGIGNFVWVKQSFYHLGRGSNPHNSYLWALTGGGIGVLVLYLLLFVVTYRMLRQLERSGPPELLWLVKGMKVNLLLFLVFSFFADFWLSDFLYFLIETTVCITNLWQTQRRRLRWPPPLSKREDRSLPQTSSTLVGTNPQAPLS